MKELSRNLLLLEEFFNAGWVLCGTCSAHLSRPKEYWTVRICRADTTWSIPIQHRKFSPFIDVGTVKRSSKLRGGKCGTCHPQISKKTKNLFYNYVIRLGIYRSSNNLVDAGDVQVTIQNGAVITCATRIASPVQILTPRKVTLVM